MNERMRAFWRAICASLLQRLALATARPAGQRPRRQDRPRHGLARQRVERSLAQHARASARRRSSLGPIWRRGKAYRLGCEMPGASDGLCRLRTCRECIYREPRDKHARYAQARPARALRTPRRACAAARARVGARRLGLWCATRRRLSSAGSARAAGHRAEPRRSRSAAAGARPARRNGLRGGPMQQVGEQEQRDRRQQPRAPARGSERGRGIGSRAARAAGRRLARAAPPGRACSFLHARRATRS